MPDHTIKTFPLPVSVELGKWAKPPRLVLLDSWTCMVEGTVYTVPEGFVSDGPSVPRYIGWRQIITSVLLATLALMRFGKLRAIRAAVLHDYLYCRDGPIVSRSKADRLFRKMLKFDGIGLSGRWIAWAAVRVGGLDHYRQEREK